MDSDKQWPLESFNDTVDVSDLRREWEEWIRAFELVLEAKNVYSQHDKLVLMLCRGGRGLQRIYYNLRPVPNEIYPAPAVVPFAPIETPEYDNAIKRLNAFFVGKCNERVELEEFRSLKQRTGESFKQFVLRLRAQASRCEFYDREEKEILHQVTMGASDERVRDKGLENVMNLDELSNYALNRELMHKQKAKSHPFASESSTSLAYVKQETSMEGRSESYRGAGGRYEPYRGAGRLNGPYRRAGGRDRSFRAVQGRAETFRGSDRQIRNECGRCGSWKHDSDSRECLARGAQCNKCGYIGHFERMCKSRQLLRDGRGAGSSKGFHGNNRLKRMLCERRMT